MASTIREKKGQNKQSGMDDMDEITQRNGFRSRSTTTTTATANAATTTNSAFGDFTLEAPSDREINI